MKFIDKYRYIISVGVELEGGICNEDLEDIITEYGGPRLSIGSDGSVAVEPRRACDSYMVTDAEIRYWSDDYDELLGFIWFVFEETSFRQNSSCGNHQHFRLRVPVAVFMDYEAYAYYILRYKEFARSRLNYKKYYARLRNRYAADPIAVGHIDNVLWALHRYAAVNFSSIYETQRTLEIRVMPYAETAQEYRDMLDFNLNTIVEIIEKFSRVEPQGEVDLSNVDKPKVVQEVGEL